METTEKTDSLNKNKTDTWLSLLFFTIVPASHLLLFFIVAKKQYAGELDQIAVDLGMSETQLVFFQVLLVLVYSVLVFLVTYFISRLVMSWFSKNIQKDKLFISFVFAITFSNLITVFLSDTLHYTPPAALLATLQVALLTGFYLGFAKAKDLRGATALAITNIIINVLPALFLQ